ncbi:Alpha/Beta hydrolase protein [Phycomyces nitens]|nr:Alpha/Beta hydrolase protein [Phycomyces nitens]
MLAILVSLNWRESSAKKVTLSLWMKSHSQLSVVRDHQLHHVYIENPNSSLVILFIHGLGGQVSQWEPQLEYFSSYANVLAVDLLGCGSSEVSSSWSDYKTDSLAKDVLALLTKHYPDGRLVLVGHSYGCSVATRLGIEPTLEDRIQGMCLICPKKGLSEKEIKAQRMIGWIPDWLVDGFRMGDRKKCLYSKSVERFLGAEATDTEREKQLEWNIKSKTAVYRRFTYNASFPLEEYSSISFPVLLVGCDQDKVVPCQDAKDIHQLIANSKLHVIKDVGHNPMLVQPQILNGILLEFIGSLGYDLIR